MVFLVQVVVTLKPGVNDPQGLTVHHALRDLGFPGVRRVRMGKYLEVLLEAPGPEEARRQAEEMCRRLLANPVIEEFRYTLREEIPSSP
jgi:phosphoribosylformylglycinamidine synthase PurS subunit